MRITLTNPEPTKAILTIKADQKELDAAKDLALKHLAPQVKVPGFREGHVPPSVVEKNVDPSTLQSEVIEHTINNLYASAIKKENLRPVANPEVAIKKFVPFTELEFDATVPVVGKVKLANYKTIKLAKKEVKITAEEVVNVIKSIQNRSAERKDVARAAKNGDEILIDFKGTDSKGELVQGADAKDYPLILGSDSFIPGFEPEIVGLKTGESKNFKVTFPGDYVAKALQNKKVTFDVTVNKISELVLPKVDDNLAAAVGPFKTVQELKDDIKTQLTFERERENNTNYESALLEKIADKSELEVPKLLVDEQIERIEEEEKQNLAYRGQTWEEHLKEEGVTAEEHKEQKRPAAAQRVKIGIMLAEIAEAEKIEVTSDEVELRLQMMRAQYQDPQAQAELNKPEAMRDIDSRIRTEKVMAKLSQYANSK